jgi:hypothetical protein
MIFKYQVASDRSQLKSSQRIKKFHINYQPTKKMKRLLKNDIPVLKEKKNIFVTINQLW